MDEPFEETHDLVEPAVFMTEIGESLELSNGTALLQPEGATSEIAGHGELTLHWDGRGLVGSFGAHVPIGQAQVGDLKRASIKIMEANLYTRKMVIQVDDRGNDNLTQLSIFPGEALFELEYKPTAPEVELEGEGRAIKKVIAHLLNAPVYLGLKISTAPPFGRGEYSTHGRFELSSSSWKVTIDHLPCWIVRNYGFWSQDRDEDEPNNALGILNSLKSAETIGGAFITHAIRVERAEGAAFNRNQARSVLGRLEVFLRFAFGGPGQAICVYGFNNRGQAVWKSLPSNPTLPLSGGQRRDRSWLPLSGDQTGDSQTRTAQALNSQLSSMFTSWMKRSEDETSNFKKMITRAVDWYTASLDASTRNQSLVLGQASLEVLSNYCLQDKLNLPEKSQQKLDFSEQLTMTLSILHIEVEIPVSFAVHRRGLRSGPLVVTKARNSVIHPRSSSEEYSDDEIGEARTLSLWYIERIILGLLNYQGPYWNRVKREVESLA